MTFLRKAATVAAIATTAVMTTAAHAGHQYAFANAYVDYLNWEHGVEDLRSTNADGKNGNRGDHFTLGIEGGAGFDWGELYGFYEYEKINWSSDERNQAMKISGHYRIAGSDFTLYGQVYDINDNKFDSAEQNRVVGIGYLGLQGEGWWFKPWIGYHDISVDGVNLAYVDGVNDSSEFQGNNGGMLGWSAGYAFTVAGQSLMLTNWNEIEFARNDAYSKLQYGDTGLNGAVGLWYDINETFYTGIQYRYFNNKLGWDGYGDAMIYRIGMHL